MKLLHSIKIALRSLVAHKARSFLTILGIVVGITSIILILSLGRGAQKLILAEVEMMGSNTIFVSPGREPQGPSDMAEAFTNSLKEKDVKALLIKANAPTISRIMPFIIGADSVYYGNESYRISIYGVTEYMSQLFNINVDNGEFLSADDVKNESDVVVIGSKVQEKLFGSDNPVGKKVNIKNKNLRIIGALPKKGQVSMFSLDDAVLIPYTTAQNYLGIKYFQHLIIEATSEKEISRTVSDVESTLRESHNITDPTKDDFYVDTQADILERMNVITNTMTLLLMCVAAISLIVGGVGIMNIMLVSVTEKTQEVGLRKSMGATNANILMQFLFESVILTGIGGAVGVFFGWVFAFLASIILNDYVPGWKFNFPVSAVTLGFGVSFLVGLIFGIYPARKASLKSPIEAMQSE